MVFGEGSQVASCLLGEGITGVGKQVREKRIIDLVKIIFGMQ